MPDSTAQHSTAQHLDNLSIKLTQLKLLLPEIFCEEQIDFQKFQQLFSDHITSEPERYMLNWAGKSEAYRILQAQTYKTLTPQPAESVNFDSTENIFIEGENLDVLKVLQKSYFNSIKMIYIDPPYNTGNDFVYNDNFKQDLKDYQEKSGELDEEGKLKLAFKKNSKENGHFHSKWLNMMLPRLHLAKNILKDDGVIFISIDDNEQAQLKLLCDEIFGEENFVGVITWIKKTKPINSGTAKFQLQKNIEYVLAYKKSEISFKLRKIEERVYDKNGKLGLCRYKDILDSDIGAKKRDTMKFPIFNIVPPEGQRWKIGEDEIKSLIQKDRIEIIDGKIKVAVYPEDEDNFVSKPFWSHFSDVGSAEDGKKELNELLEAQIGFDTVKPVDLLKNLIFSSTAENDVILDFFAGSGTTLQAVMELNSQDAIHNRKFICVQLPEQTGEDSDAFKSGFRTISEITKERILRAGKQIAENYPDKQIDTGFKVFKLTDSHFKQWQSPSAENLVQQIELFVNPVRKEATPDAMLYEILLRLGLKLTAKVRLENQVFWVSDESGQQFALLLETLSADLLDQVISAQPKKVVTLDSLFNGDDALKKNAELQMNDAGIAFFVL